MFDIIGKRNWFFAFSLLITIPGLIFLLLGPVTGGKVGLQFAIDFTGGTVWSIRFEDSTVTPQAVKDAIAGAGTEASVTQTGDGYMEIRTLVVVLAAPEPSPTPPPTIAPSASAVASATAAPSATSAPSATAVSTPTVDPSASVAPSGSAAVSAAPSATPAASPSPTPAPTATPASSATASAAPSPTASPDPIIGVLPTTGRLGEIRYALEEALGREIRAVQVTSCYLYATDVDLTDAADGY